VQSKCEVFARQLQKERKANAKQAQTIRKTISIRFKDRSSFLQKLQSSNYQSHNFTDLLSSHHNFSHSHVSSKGEMDELTTAESRFGITSFVYKRRKPFHPLRFTSFLQVCVPVFFLFSFFS
jgi:G3E family GTPase